MLRIPRSLRAVLVAGLAASGLAQQDGWVKLHREAVFDDDRPWGSTGAPLDFVHRRALVVKARDLDGDGVLDVILGGGGGTSGAHVQIHYLESGVTGWGVRHTETLAAGDSSGTYDLEIGDLDGDGWLDVVLGRRLFCPQPHDGERDTVFLNLGAAAPGGPTDDWFGAALDVPNPDCAGGCPCTDCGVGPCAPVRGQTLSVLLLDADGDGELDLATCGDYGIRYFQGQGDGGFVHRRTYHDQGSSDGHRSLARGDVDGDGDEDLVVARRDGFRTRVLFGRRVQPYGTFDPHDPFEYAPGQPDLQQPVPEKLRWTLTGACAEAGTQGSFQRPVSTFAAELGDLDGDGDLDLVTANVFGENAAFLNNGRGYFGSSDDGDASPFNDGWPAFVFPALTEDFVGESAGLTYALTEDYDFRVADPPPDGCAMTWSVPGAQLNHCSDVAIHDVDGDGLVDLAFSNRGDLGDFFQAFGETAVLPPTYDFLFFNRSTPGHLAFDRCVEMLGEANDGTGYGELVHLNPPGGPEPADGRVDWLDANFANVGPEDGEVNRVFWGHELVTSGCPQIDAPPGTDPPLDLHLAASPAFAGWSWLLLATFAGDATSFTALGYTIPLTPDCLTLLFLGPNHPIRGTLGSQSLLDVEFALPMPSVFPCATDEVTVTVVRYRLGPIEIVPTNTLHLPLSSL